MRFSDLGLSDGVLKAVEDSGYTEPTPIQARAIPVILRGRDVLGVAQTGTGKTAGFTLPMIDILAAGRARARMARTLILEPTRELAAQVSQSFEVYGKHHKLSMALLIGGVSFADQEKKLDRGVDVLIATPGRLLDHFERGKLMLTGVQILVIDEADRMLDMGFIPDVERICKLISGKRQTLFFSATMPPEIQRLADAFLDNPEYIEAAPPSSPAKTVAQYLCVVDEMDKRKALRHFLKTEEVKNAIIFCNRKKDVDVLFKSLLKHKFNAAALHGDLTQSHRMDVLDKFKRGDVQFLVASDVAARGLDITDMSHVFNFDVPTNAEDYIHRIGRTGRAGRSGRAISIASPDDGPLVAAIETLIAKQIDRVSADAIESLELSAEGSGRRRGRGGRAGKTTPARPRAARSKESPAKAAPAAPATPAAREEKKAPASEKNTPASEKNTPASGKKREQQPARARKDRAPTRESEDKPVIGMGDHVPAFLMRGVKKA